MPAKLPSIPLVKLTGGINNFENEVGPGNQCVDAENVFEDRGVLRRRPAFKSVGFGQPFVLPAGLLSLGANNADPPDYQRALAGGVNLANPLYFNCRVPFHGFKWPEPTSKKTDPLSDSLLVVEYWNGTAWTSLNVVDTTLAPVLHSNGTLQMQTLHRAGYVVWHPSDVEDWVAADLDTVSVYQIRISLTTTDDFDASGTLSVQAPPGPQPVLLHPVNGMISARTRFGDQFVLVGSDDPEPVGIEQGAKLSQFFEECIAPKQIDKLADYGTGTMDQASNPGVRTATITGGAAWPGGFALQTAGANDGTNGVLTKHQEEETARNFYEWRTNQFSGQVLMQGITLAGVTNDAARRYVEGTFTLDTEYQGSKMLNGGMRRCILLCTANGSSGTPIGEYAEIFDSDINAAQTDITVRAHAHFSVAPNAGNRFSIVAPGSKLQLDGQPNLIPISANTVNTLTPVSGSEWAEENQAAFSGIHALFAIWQELRDCIRSGERWDFIYNPLFREVLGTNGGGVWRFDGRRFYQFQPTSDPENVRVKAWVGTLPDEARDLLQPRIIAGSLLRSRLEGARLITDFQGRIVLAGLNTRPNDLIYSAPVPDIDIWPKLYSTSIRDGKNSPIVGMRSLMFNIYVWTANTLFSAGPPDENGMFRFVPASGGVSFINDKSVAAVDNSRLIGACADGVYVFDGVSMLPVLDRWDRIKPGGITATKLAQSVGAVNMSAGFYYLAVDEDIFVFNLFKNTWWRWKAPWGGVTAMVRDTDEHGTERILFGFADGHIALLSEQLTDDGATVTGWAKSQATGLIGLAEVRPDAMMSKFFINSGDIDISVYMDGSLSQADIQETDEDKGLFKAGPSVVSGEDTLGSTTFLLGENPVIVRRTPMPIVSGTEIAFKISGSGLWRFREAELVVSPVTNHRSGK